MDARKRRSQEKIIAALNGLLADHAYDVISISEIARAAGVTRQTLYSNFSSKEAIVLGYMRSWEVEMRRIVRDSSVSEAETPEKKTAAVLSLMISQFGQDYPIRRAIISGQTGSEALSIYLRFAIETLAGGAGTSPENTPPEIRLLAIYSALGTAGATEAWYRGDFEMSPQSLVDHLSRFIHHGTSTLKRR